MKHRTRLAVTLATALIAALAAHGAVLPPDGAEYAGNKMCLMCHKARNAAIVTGYVTTAHAQAMREATPETMVADFAKAPFEQAKVKYVLGRGRHQQAYVDEKLMLLPGVWDIDSKSWVPHDAVDAGTQCVACHTTGYNAEARTWTALGVQCESCHGPGSLHNKAKADQRHATIVQPQSLDPQRQMMACGQCHSRGTDKSGKFAFPQGFVPGADLDAHFTDAKPDKPGANQQFSDLRRSKHYAKGVTCEKCHDPHGSTDQPYQLRMAVNDTCLQCHKDTVKSLPEHIQAKGKEMPRPNATCATCHMPQGRHLFDLALVQK